jgi:hypothetical protein
VKLDKPIRQVNGDLGGPRRPAGQGRAPDHQKEEKTIRAADAKEVGVGNPAEETCCHPNQKPQPTLGPPNRLSTALHDEKAIALPKRQYLF